jgi:glycine/D-amino acid oxidase-like deaminating enzyme
MLKGDQMERRKFFKGIGAGAAAAGAGAVLSTMAARTMGPGGPEVHDPREPGFWEKDAGAFPETPSVESDLKVDVAIIGAGITGLSAAWTLKELRPGLKVCVIDSHLPCSGSSSRNSGHLVGAYHAWQSILSKQGPEAAVESNKFARRAQEQMLDFLQTNDIECGVHKEPLMLVAEKKQIKGLRGLAEKMKQAGLGGVFYEGEEFQEQSKVKFYHAAVEDDNQYLMHPGKLMKGFLLKALDRGIKVFGNSPVLKVVSNDSDVEANVLKTPGADVVAKKVIFATNAYTPRINGLLSSRMVPIIVATVATRPMTPQERDRAGFKWNHLKDSQILSHTFGVTPDNRVYMRGIFGYAAFNACTWKNEETAYRRLEREMRERIPYVEGLEVTEKWYGPVGMNISGTPMVGPLRRKGQYACLCYNGVGMVDGFYQARILAHQIAGAPHPDVDWLKGPYDTGWIPPEPWRSIGAKTFMYFGL